MTDNIVQFPGTTTEIDKEKITPEVIMDAARDRYEELILIGRTKDSSTYECVSTTDVAETLFHVTRIQHRLNVFLDGKK
jgi:hypothetical protein